MSDASVIVTFTDKPEAATPGTGAAAVETESAIARLTGRMTAGDEEAFREFHQLYFDRLYRHLLVSTHGDETAAQEALQETLCRVARYIRRFEQEETFWCWLAAVSRSAARDGGRKVRRYRVLLQSYAQRYLPLFTQQTHDDQAGLQDALTACLAELAAEDRALLEGKYYNKNSMRELGMQMHTTERAVESRLLRLRRQLREAIIHKLRSQSL